MTELQIARIHQAVRMIGIDAVSIYRLKTDNDTWAVGIRRFDHGERTATLGVGTYDEMSALEEEALALLDEIRHGRIE